MKRSLLLLLIVLAALVVMTGLALTVPSSLPTNSDFDAIYYTDVALVHGVNVYDLPGIARLAAGQLGVPADALFLPRFPYPPWYALATFYLGLLPIQAAATLWFELNLAMLFLSVWLLGAGLSPLLRLLAFPLALLFLPVLGTLAVGQYDFPILLGAALALHALRTEKIARITLGAALLTFKPHIGMLILLAVLILLARRNDRFGRRAILSILAAGAGLFLIGFLADRAWPIDYLKLLFNYQNEGNVTACSVCASLPIWLARSLLGQSSLTLAAALGALVLLVCLVWMLLIRPPLWRSAGLLISAVTLTTLLANPYLYNYDFALLLIPMACLLSPPASRAERLLIAAAYLSPFPAIILLGRAGNLALLAAALVLIVVLTLRAHIDGEEPRAYNQP